MSIFRKAAVTTVILGAGLGSLSGVAMAHESAPAPAGGCSNAVAAESANGAEATEGDTTGGSQEFGLENTCDFLNDNQVLNGANVATGDSAIRNGDNVTTEETTTETTTSTITETLGGLL